MNKIAIEPMGVGEILGKSFKLYWKNLRTFFGISLVGNSVYLAMGLLLGVLSFDYAPEVWEKGTVVEAMINLIGSIPLLILSVLLAGALTGATYYLLNAEDVTLGKVYKLSANRFWAMVGTGILFTLGVLGGFILLIIPGIFLAVRWSLNQMAVVLENVSGTVALGRSRDLVKGFWWRTFGFIILIGIISGLMSLVVEISVAAIGEHTQLGIALANFLKPVGVIITTPFQAIATTIYYYDLKGRKEGAVIKAEAVELEKEEDSG